MVFRRMGLYSDGVGDLSVDSNFEVDELNKGVQ